MSLKEEDITYNIIGAAFEVHNNLGHGFLEGVYQEAMEIELQSRDFSFVAKKEISIDYKGNQLKTKYKPDLLVSDAIIVEIKALQQLSGTEESQLLNYLKATKKEVGLLINFGSPSLKWKRMVLTEKK